MAEKKKTAVSKKVKGSKVSKKAKVSKGANIRTQRISNKVKLKSTAKSIKNSRYTVSVVASNVETRYGIINSIDESSIGLITKPKSGSSKEGLMLIDRANVISVEGSLGEDAKVLVHEQSEVALFKDVSISLKNGAYTLKETDGSEIHIQKRPGLTVNAIAFA